MHVSVAQFFLCLLLSQQLMKFARVNQLTKLEKWYKYALIFTISLFITEAIFIARGDFKWFWHLLLLTLIVVPLQQSAMRPLRMFLLAFLPYVLISLVSDLTEQIDKEFFNSWVNYFSNARLLALIWLGAILFSHYRQRKTAEKERLKRQKEEELNRAIAIRKIELEGLVAERTAELTEQKKELEKALAELQATQSQLIYSEKMASLGELTAGVAHEMQNPLNFVNNFSEVSMELLDEMSGELEKGNNAEAIGLAEEIRGNLKKITHHGKSADAVVKGMLMHSRRSLGTKEKTDINALADEYLRLSYFSLRAKDKTFSAVLKTDFDKSLSPDISGNGKVEVYPQELGRVILNLINNAFYAVREKKSQNAADYVPTVTISTKRIDKTVEITVKDNGPGIPATLLSKIFQPFFTTKPTGEGTGLGLSLSYDIVTKVHGGELDVETKEGEYSSFIVRIPVE